MTISYSGNFCQLLRRWKGSLWKSVWKELIIFLVLYYIIRIIYKFGLTNEPEKTNFENVCLTFNNYTKSLPLTFLLGFYVASIVGRWWTQFEWVAWPDDFLSQICSIMPGKQEDTRLKRHTIARYVCLTAALSWRDVSERVRHRFPTVQHLVRSGLMTADEYILYTSVKTESLRWFLPLQWTQKLLLKCAKEFNVPAPIFGGIIGALNNYRLHFRKLYCYDWVCIPLVYTQVASLAVYGYFTFCLLGRQFLDPAKKYKEFYIDLYIPFFTILQFLFYVGWFKVGQDLMRPFGCDDDDIELNYILDRHIHASFTLVGDVEDQEPPLIRDKFFENPSAWLMHTKKSAKFTDHPPKQHTIINTESDAVTIVDQSKHRRVSGPGLEESGAKNMNRKHWRWF